MDDVYGELKKKGINVFDRVRVSVKGKATEGILMPKTGFVGKGIVVIKLDNGYNVGIDARNAEIKLLERGRKFKEGEKTEKRYKEREEKNFVSVLACGGTIASRVEYETGAVSPLYTAEEIINSVPELRSITGIKARNVMNVFSEDMQPEHWQRIAKEVERELKNGSEGVVITHGTDSMHYTSAALSFMLQNLPVPVVLTGAQRSSDRPSSDAYVNLTCSVLASKSNLAEVCVCMHASESDDFCLLHRGTRVRKMHSSARSAFKSVNSPPLGKVDFKKRRVEFFTDRRKRGKRSLVLNTKINPNVGLVKVYPGIKPEFIKNLSKFFDGVVMEVSGLGHVPSRKDDEFSRPIINEVKELISSNIPVVIAPQTVYGALNLNVYENGRKLLKAGVIGNGCDWLAEVAVVKLMWVLGQTKDMKKVRDLMLKNIAGEISSRRWLGEDSRDL